MKPRIYLAGKIGHNDWRHQCVPSLRGALLDIGSPGPFGSVETASTTKWPYLDAGAFIYTGPFFTSCDHGCAHGTGTHGDIGGCICDVRDANPHAAKVIAESKTQIIHKCLRAIDESDVILAWLDADTSAHGTLFELGLGIGSGKRVVVAMPSAFVAMRYQSQMWFAINSCEVITAETPKEAFARLTLECAQNGSSDSRVH